MDTVYVIRLVVGLAMTVAALAVSGRRAYWLYRLIRSGQPAATARTSSASACARSWWRSSGSASCCKWSVPGVAHFFMFWAFVILATVYLEAYGALFDPGLRRSRSIGHWPVLGFLQDFIAVLALVSARRLRGDPAPQRARAARRGRRGSTARTRRRLAHPVHDLQRHLDDVPVPRRALGAGQPPLRRTARSLDRRRQPARRPVRRARSRCSRASACCCTSA